MHGGYGQEAVAQERVREGEMGDRDLPEGKDGGVVGHGPAGGFGVVGDEHGVVDVDVFGREG